MMSCFGCRGGYHLKTLQQKTTPGLDALLPAILEKAFTGGGDMNYLLSRLTFGFFMAQLFPGAVSILSLTLALRTDESGIGQGSVFDVCNAAGRFWFDTPLQGIVFLFFATGAGMLIHGLHWTVLAWLENHGDDKPVPSRESFWHKRPIWLQLLVSPIKMVLEIVWVLGAPSIDKLTMDENVPKFSPDRMPLYEFLQSFYLHFGQFYAHTAYSLLVSIPCLAVAFARSDCGWRGMTVLLVVLYLGCSTFFILGRVQLNTLFKAERELQAHRG